MLSSSRCRRSWIRSATIASAKSWARRAGLVGEGECALLGRAISCFRFGMCLAGLCWCSAEECEARNVTKVSFDILLDGDEMQGVVEKRAVWLKRRE